MVEELILTGLLVERDDRTRRWTELLDTLLSNLRSRHSQRAYAQSLRAFFAWCQTHPAQVTKKQIIVYRDELRDAGASAATVNRHLAAIRALYKAALDEGLLERNPAAGVKTLETSADGNTPALKKEQVEAMLRAIDRATLQGVRDYALILLLVRTGLRREEAARLQVADLQQRQGHWVLDTRRKGGKTQYVKVPADVYRAMQVWIVQASLTDGALWRHCPRQGRGLQMQYLVGGLLTSDGMLKIVQARARKARIPIAISPHVLRATFITLALDAGAPLHKVQYAAGHADPRTTERYHRSKQNLDDNAVDYIRLDLDQIVTVN